MDFSGPLAVSLFLLSHNGIVPFFSETVYHCGALLLTQMHTDGLRWDTDILILYLCLIRVNSVHLWLVFRRGRLRLIIDCMRKNGGKEQNGLRKYSVCAAAQAANVYNYKHKPRIAGEPAFSISRFRD